MSESPAPRSSKKKRSEPERDPLPNDRDAERVILSAILADHRVLEDIGDRLIPNQFYYDAHSRIFSAMLELKQSKKGTDVISVANHLRDTQRLQQVGGTAYLGELIDSVPFAVPYSGDVPQVEGEPIPEPPVDQYIEIVTAKWKLRLLVEVAALLEAKGRTGNTADPVEEIREALSRFELITQPSEDLDSIGGYVEDWQDPCVDPPKEDWLLWDDISDKPAIPLGRATLLSAAGGTGKTTFLAQLVVAVALGLPFVGFRVARPGPVAFCCGESDKPLMLRHLHRAYNSFGLDDDQRRYAAKNIIGIPLMGKEVNVIGDNGRNGFERTPFLDTLKRFLVRKSEKFKHDYSLIVLDPLSRFSGPDTEKDNSAATRYCQAIETLCQLPGKPTVCNAHHSSKQSGQNGRNDARGVTGIVDGFRSNSTLTACRAETIKGVLMTNTKNNEAPHFPDRWLVQQQEKGVGGTLRLATEPESEMLHEASKEKNRNKPSRPRQSIVMPDKPAAAAVILARLRELGGVAQSRNWLRSRISNYDNNALQRAFAELADAGTIRIESSGKNRGQITLVENNTQMELL